MSKKTAAAVTAIFVTVRYFVKSTKSIVSIVRSGDNDYTVTLNRSKNHSCSCDGNAVYHRQCKHIKQCVAIENARAEREAQARKQQAEQEIEQLVSEVESEMSREDAACVPAAAAQPQSALLCNTPAQGRSTSTLYGTAPLSSVGQAFSLLKVG